MKLFNTTKTTNTDSGSVLKIKVIAAAMSCIIACATVFMLAGCSGGNDGNNNGDVVNTAQTVTYSGYSGSVLYTLKVTENLSVMAVYAAKGGDSYELTVGAKKSTGTVNAVQAGVMTLAPSKNPAQTFTATVSGSDITAMSGVVLFDGNDGSQEAPSTLTQTEQVIDDALFTNEGEAWIDSGSVTKGGYVFRQDNTYDYLSGSEHNVSSTGTYSAKQGTLTIKQNGIETSQSYTYSFTNLGQLSIRNVFGDVTLYTKTVITNVEPTLPGTITVSAAENKAIVGNLLTAVYNDGLAGVSYTWKRGSEEVGNQSAFTPQQVGSYTVTVSLEGYKSLVSAAVAVKSGNSQAFESIAALDEYLSAQPANTVATAFDVSLDVESISGLSNTLKNNDKKYVSLDLSGSAFTSIAKETFEYCSTLTSIIIPEGVTDIGDYAFHNCSNLESVMFFGETLKTIGKETFWYCPKLSDISLPASLTTIKDMAFEMSGITSITIPKNVTSIGATVFRVCNKLTQINVETANANYSSLDGVLYNKAKTTLIAYPTGKTQASFTVPASVTGFSDGAFEWNKNLTEVILHDGIKSLAWTMFESSAINNLIVPASVTSISNSAFLGCENLTTITFLGSSCSINSNAFGPAGDLHTKYAAGGAGMYTRPNGQSYVWTKSQYNSQVSTPVAQPLAGKIIAGTKVTLTSTAGADIWYTLDGSTPSVDGATSTKYTSQITINYPVTIKAIGSKANTKESSMLTAVYTIDGPVTYNAQSIADASVWLTALPANTLQDLYIIKLNVNDLGGSYGMVGSLGKAIKQNDSKFVELDLSSSTITKVDSLAFGYCTGLTGIKLPETVESIGNSAFKYCSKLESIDIPDNCISIGNESFSGCSTLVSANIGKGVTTINMYAFYDCGKLANFSIPEKVSEIRFGACSGCKALTEVVIPASVIKIQGDAFYGCDNLVKVTFDCDINNSDNFQSQSFPGDLRTKYMGSGGGAGTYERTLDSEEWTKR
ncbi:MAG: leucine-rich repeat protein [Chitinispirillales bacterium]|jgi:hypothetical protein|nr:leucine-rich repeat protein [Chitinispirillales bacterium]